MDNEKFKSLISTMTLICMTGNIEVKMQYVGQLADHLIYYINSEKISKNRPVILTVRSNLISAFNFLVSQNSWNNQLSKNQTDRIQDDFKKYCIVLDSSWTTPQAVSDMSAFRQMEAVRAAKDFFLRAIANYSQYRCGDPDGLTGCMFELDQAMRLLTMVCHDLQLLDISEGEFRKAIQQSQPQPPAAEPANIRR